MLALNFVYVVGSGRAVKSESRRHRKRGSHRPIPRHRLRSSRITSAPQTAMAAPSTGAHSLLSAFRLRGEMVRCRAGSQEAAIAAVETLGRSAGAAVTAAERSGRQGASLSILARISSYCDAVRAVFDARGHSAAGSKAERRFDEFSGVRRRPLGIGGAAFASMRTVRCLVRQRRGDEPGVRDPVFALDWGRMRPWRA